MWLVWSLCNDRNGGLLSSLWHGSPLLSLFFVPGSRRHSMTSVESMLTVLRAGKPTQVSVSPKVPQFTPGYSDV